jgi:predicted nucleic acid-binding protein
LITYIEASAAAKLVLDERASPALAEWIDDLRAEGTTAFTSVLTETEVRRAATRAGAEQQLVTDALEKLALVDFDRADFRAAGLLPGSVRSLDALHVAVALRIGADVMVTYDERQAEAARGAGLNTLSPA